MNIKIIKINDAGNLPNERIVLKSLTDIDVGRFGIFRTGIGTSGITNKVHNAYWFPDQLTRAGDLVVLYTKSGVSSSVKNKDGSTTFFYYWGLSSTIWNDENKGSVVVAIPTWSVFQRE